MNIVLLMKQVPDLVEELEIDASGKSLDSSFLRFITSEFDDHALEQALLLKEKHGGRIQVLAMDLGEVDEALFTALAKGADAASKVTGSFEGGLSSHGAAQVFEPLLKAIPHDLVLTGVQAIDDLDGQVGPLLAGRLGVPYVGVVNNVEYDDGAKTATVRKEYPGGVVSEVEVKLPAVLGIQAAPQPPRYVPIAKIRQAMKTARIEETPAPDIGEASAPPGIAVRRMYKPEAAGHAEMITGGTDEVAGRIVAILTEKGVLR